MEILALKKLKQIIKQNGTQADELCLEDVKVGKISAQMQKTMENCKHLQIISLNNCQLNSLQNMPKINLTALDLSRNMIKDSQLRHLKQYINLSQLFLVNNQISSITSLNQLQQCSLNELDLSDNPITSSKDYRNKVFKILKHLEILDRYDSNGNEIEESEEIGEEENGEEENGQDLPENPDQDQDQPDDDDEYDDGEVDQSEVEESEEEEEEVQKKPHKNRKK